MTRSLAYITFREWRQHKLRLALTILGIALGVAVFFSVRTSNKTLVNSLNSTIEKLAGRATLQVVSGESGFPIEILDRVTAVPGVLYAEPLTETFATMPSGEKVLILGLDTSSELEIYVDSFDRTGLAVRNPLAFASRADSIALTHELAADHGLKEGDRFTVNVRSGPMSFTVRGLFNAAGIGQVFGGRVAVMDLASAQDAFGRGTRIDRIDIATRPDTNVDAVKADLETVLPSGIRIVRPELRGEGMERSVASMHYGLTIMSFLALIIGVFIIFNSFTISVNQRWKQLGVLRALGVEQGGIQRMFLAEGVVLGLIGSFLGIVAGFILASLSAGFIGEVTASFYGFVFSPTDLDFNLTFAAQALAAGVLASVAGAWLPARTASRLDPVLALHNIESPQRELMAGKIQLAAGIVLVAIGFGLTHFVTPAIGQNIQLFFAFLMQFGSILLVPWFVQAGAFVLRPLMDRVFGIEGLIAVQNMARSRRRTTATVIALMVGLGFVYSHGALIDSHKNALLDSFDKALAADMLVTASNEVHSKTYHFDEATALAIGSLPEVRTADAARIMPLDYKGQEVLVIAHDMNAYFDVSPDLLDSGSTDVARTLTSEGRGLLASNNFSERWDVGVGDAVTLDTPSGPVTLTVAGTLNYYRSERGTLFFDRRLVKKYWHDSDVDYIFIDLKPGADRALLKTRIEQLLAGRNRAFVYTHDEYKTWVETMVNQFFGLIYIQMFAAFLVAGVGLANTMVISVAERRRELGILRAIGGLRSQVTRIVIYEAVAVSIIGIATGVISGVLNAYFLVNTASRVIAGFSLKLQFPFILVIYLMPVVVAVAIVSAWFPARNASRMNVSDAISYE